MNGWKGDLRSAVGLVTLLTIVAAGIAVAACLFVEAVNAHGATRIAYGAALFALAVCVVFTGSRVMEWGTRP